MREVAFIKQNKDKWLRFEQSFFTDNKLSTEELADLYVELMNDLSYAQTFYPNSKTELYLNELASKAYLTIYKSKRLPKKRLITFFTTDVPLVAYQYRKYIYLSFGFFLLFVLIGIVSASNDEMFIRLILGDEYVNITKENIRKGNPTAIYGSGSHWGSSILITTNNINVAFKCFIYGIFAGIGTMYILLSNGIMLGAFHYMFFQEGVLMESMRAIWIHGAIEIFVICISGGCGFILGASILFPNTYSRLQSFKSGFKHSLMLLLSTVPFFIIAGSLEGFITRYSHKMPIFLSLIIIFTSLILAAFYYLIYPHFVHRKVSNHVTTLQTS